ncbi:MAG: ester cyclase family protein [Saprospiraceae bacterium]|nr:ester cyclase family protein [Saprospiraceae bacterium]
MRTRIILILLSCFIMVTVNAQKDAKATIQNAYDALNRKDWNAFAALCDEKNYTDVNVAPTPIMGVWNALEAYKEFFNAFTDMKIAVNEIGMISPTRYLVRVTLSGKHTGTLMGIPATGKMMQYNDCDIVEVNAQGKIIHHEPIRGGSEVFRQIGVDPGSPTIANKQLVDNIMSELNRRNLDNVIKSYAADARFHGWAPQAIDVNGYKAAMSEILNAFPDSKFPILDMIADGDKVVVRHQLEGTHTGAAFQGIPVTNKKVLVPATVTLRFANGKVVEGWLNADFLGLMMQLNSDTAMKK